jgi:quinol monooxygenase YgiN
MAVRVVLQMRAKPGEGDRMIEVLNQIMPDTAKSDGAVEFELLRDCDDGDKFVVIERWRDRADHEAYMAWRERTGIGREELAPVIGGPVVITYCDAIGAW